MKLQSIALFAVASLAASTCAFADPPKPCRLCDQYKKASVVPVGTEMLRPNAVPAPTPASAETDPLIVAKTTPTPRAFAYDLSAVRLGSGDIVEFKPIDIKWTLSLSEYGAIGPSPTRTDIEVCPAIKSLDPPSTCGHIPSARPGRKYTGTISVPAPPAGKPSTLIVVATQKAPTPPGSEDYGKDVPVAEANVQLEVGATYDVAITGFEVITTRSTSTDTIWTTLKGMVKAAPPDPSESDVGCNLAGFAWCVFNQKYGDVDGGKHTLAVRVGPYFLVPEREQDLRILFWVDNHSDNVAQEIGLAVANAFSKIGMIALSASGSGLGSSATQLDSAMEGLHSTMFASCDGVVATDIAAISNVTIANQPQYTLDAFTRSTGEHVVNIDQIYHNTDGDFRCDRRGGNYRVSYTVYRTSWRDWGFRPAY